LYNWIAKYSLVVTLLPKERALMHSKLQKKGTAWQVVVAWAKPNV
jgi:hypothetical protein